MFISTIDLMTTLWHNDSIKNSIFMCVHQISHPIWNSNVYRILVRRSDLKIFVERGLVLASNFSTLQESVIEPQF